MCVQVVSQLYLQHLAAKPDVSFGLGGTTATLLYPPVGWAAALSCLSRQHFVFPREQHFALPGACYLLLDTFALKILSASAGRLLRMWGNFLSLLYVNAIRTVSSYLHNFREIVLCFCLFSSPFNRLWGWARRHK